MVEERRWSLTNKVTQLDAGYGKITTIKWKDNLIAWANEKVTVYMLKVWASRYNLYLQMVLVYDIALKEKITSISFEEERYLLVCVN